MSTALSYLNQVIPGIQAIWLFGSAISDPANAEDIDIAFLATDRTDAVDRFEWSNQLAGMLGKEVDLIDMRIASTVMQFQVISNGELIFALDNREADKYASLVYSMYLKLNEDRAEILKGVQEDGTVYG